MNFIQPKEEIKANIKQLSPNFTRKIKQYYKNDIKKMETMLGIDLNLWLN